MWSIHKLNAKGKRTNEGYPDVPSSQDALQNLQTTFDEQWGFTAEDLERFPALRKRNFWCIQRHQARALHYDLRMQLDGATYSWAIPRGLLGMSKDGEVNRLAVETTLHPISYTTHEGADGRLLPSGERGGTLLWDIGTYTISYPWTGEGSDSDNERERRKKKRRSMIGIESAIHESNSDDPNGRHEEDKFRQAMRRKVRMGKSRSIHFTLSGGYKMTNHHYILVLSGGNTWAPTYSDGYPWGPGGEEGEEFGRSVKSLRRAKDGPEDLEHRA
ncbi:DNA polymerase ligase-domain-containing protein [Kockovaella imperatae]|uniref:DNA polymerase ligase-domain-containing protein n=1 Tax=Kockovaella imperatae TaxID=4999 RepID=A0A1Y1UD66_9TREE|nr:DNA polymerase ligase-domain-containing protein [Kockovaella imperatae]ORX35487.1 DNA polymerase ligase-domain-containing protein [Kockovaella imperatae]